MNCIIHLSSLIEKNFIVDYLNNKGSIHLGNTTGDYLCFTALDNGNGVYTLAKNPDMENARILTIHQFLDHLEGRGQDLIIDLDFGFIEYEGNRLDAYDLVKGIQKIVLSYDGRPIPLSKISKIIVREKDSEITHFVNVEQ